MANQPTLKVEISFVSTPLATAPTWVDVTTYVRMDPPLTIHRGRQSELDNFGAAHCTMSLSNRDRRFDPSYAAGPYFGNLIPRKQIRVTATWAAVDYVMFQGWVTGWPQAFAAPAGLDSMVTIEAIDGLAWLAENNVPNDLVYSYANTTIGSLGFFLRGADTAAWSDATSNGYTGSLVSGRGTVGSTLVKGMASTPVAFDGSTKWRIPRFTAAGVWSLSFWIQTTDTTGLTDIMGGGAGGSGTGVGPFMGILLASDGSIVFSVGVSLSGYDLQSSAAYPVNDGIPHHVVITSDNSVAANTRIYIDGTDRTGGLSGSAVNPFLLDTIGAIAFVAVTGFFKGSLQDLGVFNKQLSAGEVSGLYQRSSGYLEESTAARVTRILDDVGWPAAWRSITTTQRGTCGELVYNSRKAIELLQEVQRTEQGRIFASRTNSLTFLDRYYAQEQAAGMTVQQIFSDDGGATALPYSSFEFQFNDVDVVNQATVTTPTTWASSSDATSITANGLQSKKVDTILSTFAAANSMAAGLVAQGKTATYRIAPIMTYPANNTSRWDELLVLELGYRIGIEITPMKVGSQNAQEVTLEQIEWSAGELWSVVVAGSPIPGASGVGAGWIIVGTSTVGGPDVVGY